MRIASLILPAALLAGCSIPLRSTHEAPSVHGPVVYSCEDGVTLLVRFDRENAHVTMPSGEEVVLPQQPSGSGIAYGTPQQELRGKGNEATWRVGRRVPIACRVRP